jgi:hypothetical protein
VAIVALGAVASLVSYSDAAIRRSLVDTYEPSAWNLAATTVLAAIAIACALVTRVASRRAVRRTVAGLQIGLLLASIAVAAFGHYRLMQRATELTGRTFEGFP